MPCLKASNASLSDSEQAARWSCTASAATRKKEVRTAVAIRRSEES
jgi:hypothetical protein